MRTFVDLFCGIGGFRLALEPMGLECVYSSDINENARQTYKDNFKELPAGDITQIHAGDIPRHDVLCGGFPCQSFSLAGKRGAFRDKRGLLFYDIVRIAIHHQPDLLLLENVKNILSVDKGAVCQEIYSQLDRAGYRVVHLELNASHYGVPQARKRIYFVGLRKDLPMRFFAPFPEKTVCCLDDIIESNVTDKKVFVDRNWSDVTVIREPDSIEAPVGRPIILGYIGCNSQGQRLYSTAGHAITMNSGAGGWSARSGLYWIDERIRTLTVTEVKRVMGFPDRFKVPEGNVGRSLLGNAVVPNVVKKVYQGVKYVVL